MTSFLPKSGGEMLTNRLDARTAELVLQRNDRFAKRVDRIFSLLIAFQWVASIAVALILTPRSWNGLASQLHPHVYSAIFLGGVISSLPLFLAITQPGSVLTRHAIAAAQLCWSALLILITNGRIETHFHVFGSLALLAWYRDVRVLLTAVLVTVIHHTIGGLFLPETVYGVTNAGLSRTIEHGFWVLFECGFLALAIRQMQNELVDSCRMQAELEQGYQRVGEEVRVKTAHLERANESVRAGAAFLERVGDVAGVGGWRIDLATNELTWTEQTRRLHEVASDYRPTIESALAFYAPDARPTITAAVEAGIRYGTPWDLELPIITANGNRRFVRAVGNVELRNNVAISLVGAIQDVTTQKQSELEIRKLSVIVEQTPASVVLTDTKGQIEYVNPAFNRETGYEQSEVIGKNCRILKSGLMPAETYLGMWRELRAGREWRGELQNRRKNGELYWVLAVISPVTDTAGAVNQFMAVQENITGRKAVEDELRCAARTDKLTGLANRTALALRLEAAVQRAREDTSYHFAVLFLDFDRFKNVNDSLGHDVGDMLLCEIARRLRAVIPSGNSSARENITARLGGDEFVILLDGTSSLDAVRIYADKLIQTFASAYRLGEHEVYSSASIGVVTDELCKMRSSHDALRDECVNDKVYNAEDILRDADTAMYEAKLAGKGRYLVFDVSMRERMQSRAALENDLRRSLDRGELFLMYQPIVSLTDQSISTFEALVRWRHPERGLISPGEFIAIAEDTGLIVPIGEWVLREACTQFARWRNEMGDRAPQGISVNISRKQLLIPGLVGIVRQVLEQTQLPPASLHLEITESAVMQDLESAACVLHEIKALGVTTAIDDFGTGYSSLACLRKFPCDVLKIDRSFVVSIDRGRDFAALVHAISQLARNLEIAVVAEGIETLAQAMALQSLDCNFGQGNLFSPPIRADEVVNFRLAPKSLPGNDAAA